MIMAWGRGWAVSRGVPPPVEVPGGFRAEVGLPHHRVRHVLHTWSAESLHALVLPDSAPGAWVKVVGSRDDLRAALPAPWTTAADGWLMSTEFTVEPGRPVAPYRTEVTESGGTVTAVARDADGTPAAWAHLARAGAVGVVDRVETAPEHRRRGLGSAVMRALGRHAVESGMATGVLVATKDGCGLYRALGWEVRAGIAAAWVPAG